MGDPNSRKKQALNRLRAQLKKKKESLADQFDFKMYIAFVFKDKRKKSALFEVSEVIPVMTNNYEENILKGVRDSSYSLESSIELLQKDIVQLHAPRYQSMRRDVIGCTQEMDFILWPRNDIEKIVCLLFSRWKGSDDEPFRPVQARFEFHHGDYETQFLHVLSRKDKTGIVINNPNQSVFLFIDRQHLQKSQHCQKMLPWSCGRHDLRCSCARNTCLPTKVVPIYLLAFACFRTARLAGAGASNRSSFRHVALASQTTDLLIDKLSILTTEPQQLLNLFFS